MVVFPRSRLFLGLVLVGATAFATACGAGSDVPGASDKPVDCDFPPQKRTTVNVLAYNSSAIDPFANAMVNSCSKNGVTVKRAPVDFSGQYQKTATTLAGNQGTYDIIEMYSGAVPGYAATGKLLPLDDLLAKYAKKYQLDDIDPAMLKGLSHDGKLYALPMQANVGTMIYRKDIFAKAGLEPPTTYAELLAAARKIKKAGLAKHPVALPFSDSTSTLFEQTMSSQGKTYVNPENKAPTFDTPEAAKGVKALKDLVPYMDPDVFAFNQPRVQQQMVTGKAAVTIMFSGRMADMIDPKQSAFAKKFAFAAPPSIAPGGKAGSLVSVDGWSIPANSRVDPDLLFRIMAASTGRETSEQAMPAAYPARQGVTTAGNPPYAAAVEDALARGAANPPMATWLGNMQNATSPLLQRAVSGRTPVQTALTRCQKAGAAVLADD
ncbi:extracellular solute-binding protein [Streptomyces sp. NPDC005925]|uniref:ABC transporter substrate-binding protein n=1 Tax=Streptomyces sp. NPDC005925 TaxID=3157172 RepID=UPI0033E9E015